MSNNPDNTQAEPDSDFRRWQIIRDVTDICFDNGGVTKPMADALADYVAAYTNKQIEAVLDRLESKKGVVATGVDGRIRTTFSDVIPPSAIEAERERIKGGTE